MWLKIVAVMVHMSSYLLGCLANLLHTHHIDFFETRADLMAREIEQNKEAILPNFHFPVFRFSLLSLSVCKKGKIMFP